MMKELSINKTATTKKTVIDYLNDFYNKFTISDLEERLIFRGQANENWNVASSAGRRLDKFNKNKQDEFIRYHINLIENARKNGYNKKINQDEKLNDLEILAEIQHFGGATCLTDFTTNFLTALWFACEETIKTDKKNNKIENEFADGRVLWLDLGSEKNSKYMSYYNKYRDTDTIENLLKKSINSYEMIEPRFWIWEPSKLNNRIVKQDSVFIFSLSAFDEKKLDVDSIPIFYADKKDLRRELEDVFNICTETIYYDLPGFSHDSNGGEVEISRKILNNKSCLRNVKKCIQKEEYLLALNFIDQCFSCNNNKVDPMFKGKCGNNEKPCKNPIGDIFYFKGEANEGLGNLDDALLNYYQATKILKKRKNSKLLFDCYRNQSYIYYEKDCYDLAEKINHEMYLIYLTRVEDIKADKISIKKNKDFLDGIDSLFSLIELSIIQLDKESYYKYIGYLDDLQNQFKEFNLIEGNGIILKRFFERFGEYIIMQKNFDIDDELTEFDKITKRIQIVMRKNINKISGDNIENESFAFFNWDFDDLTNWLEDNKNTNSKSKSKRYIAMNSNHLLLFIKKANESQSLLKEMIFAELSTAKL